jgi:CofD-related protein of GAK system
MRIQLTREATIPDPLRLARYERLPELGPRILFFSGGTALRGVSREIIRYTHNTIHLITPFDSGGSSAKLREAFHMPAVGDVRNRLMALADTSLTGNPAIFAFFSHRFPKNAENASLHQELDRMARGRQRLVNKIPDPMRKLIRNHLRRFQHHMPQDFDLRGASMGNLVLTGGYLNNRRQIDPVIYLFSKLVQVRGEVRPVVNNDVHLAADLDNGETIVGQHNMTGKETAPLDSPIRELRMVKSLEDPRPASAKLRKKRIELIRKAELICYPMGSFFTSLLANLLPEGVGRAVAGNPCPKLFIPNTGHDPELLGHTVQDQIDMLADRLVRDDPGRITPDDVLTHVLLDARDKRYPGLQLKQIVRKGFAPVSAQLASSRSEPLLDARLTAQALMSLV